MSCEGVYWSVSEGTLSARYPRHHHRQAFFLTVSEIPAGNVSGAAHDPCAPEDPLVGDADEAAVADVWRYEGVFSAGDVWVAGEFDGF